MSVIDLKNYKMKKRIIWRFLLGYIPLILIAIFVLSFFVSVRLRGYYESKISERLLSNAFLLGESLKNELLNNNQQSIQQKTKKLAAELDARITIIDKQGKVLGDSEKSPHLMENHSDRLEVIRAIENGNGQSTRFSDTLGYNMKYVALSIRDNSDLIGVIRLAIPLTEVESQIRVLYRVVLAAGAVAAIFALGLGYFISKSIASPISQMKEIAGHLSRGDFSRRVNIGSKDELGDLARSLNRMADELQLKIDNLKKVDKVRTDFVANVSHELKTPLTSIKGFVETLEDGALDDKENAKKFISIIKKHTEGLNNIVNDLLSLSELELGRDRVNKSKFDLKELIDEVILGFGHALSVKGEKLDFKCKGSNFKIQADRMKIEQVLVNIIDNAIKYSKEAGLVLVSLLEEKNKVIVSVKDNGIGIPPEHLNRIFERFYRVDKARSRQFGGTGLGLAIVKHIVLLHSGTVDIESQVNNGTEVTISLPLG